MAAAKYSSRLKESLRNYCSDSGNSFTWLAELRFDDGYGCAVVNICVLEKRFVHGTAYVVVRFNRARRVEFLALHLNTTILSLALICTKLLPHSTSMSPYKLCTGLACSDKVIVQLLLFWSCIQTINLHRSTLEITHTIHLLTTSTAEHCHYKQFFVKFSF